MPTLGTLPIHRALRTKLENLDNTQPSEQNTTTTSPSRAKAASGANIHTPQALLSRDPKQIRDRIGPNIPLHAILDLRASVANALIQDENHEHGREAQKFVNHVDNLISESSQPFSSLNNIRHSSPFIDGSFTALDYCFHSFHDQYLADRNPNTSSFPPNRTDEIVVTLSSIHTGSERLDDLLSSSSDSTSALKSTFTQFLPSRNVYLNSPNAAYLERKLNGGIAFGIVTEVTGPPASGKTQLALTLAINASKQNIHVHYLAAGGGNRTIIPLARRLYAMSRSPRSESSSQSECLHKIHFHSVKDGYHALAIMDQIKRNSENLHEEIVNDVKDVSKKRILLILDSASGCLSPNILVERRDGGIGSSLIHEVGMALRRLARIYQHAVFVTNGTVGCINMSSNGNSADVRNDHNQQSNIIRRHYQPAMKNMWKVADIRICFDILEDLDKNQNLIRQDIETRAFRRKIRATLDKHYAKSCNPAERYIAERSAEFALWHLGVTDLQEGR